MRLYARWLVGAALYTGCIQFAFLAAIQNPGNPHNWEKARLTDLVAGQGHRPFVYRALLPGSVRFIRNRLPDSVTTGLQRFADHFDPLRELFAATPAADEDDPVTYLIAYALECACLAAFALTLRSALIHFYHPNDWAADLLPLAAVLGLTTLYRYIAFDYDFPQLFLFTLGLLLLARRAWPGYYAVLLIGAFNKETTVLLLVIHLLAHHRRLPRAALLAHAAAQLLILVAVRALLQFVLYADNPGQPVEVWLGRNWHMVTDPARWGFLFFHFAWAGRTALIVPTNYNLLFLLALPLVTWKWNRKPSFLRRAVWIVPIQVALAMIVGQIDEMRVYYEVYVVLFLLAAGSLCHLYDTVEPPPAAGALPGHTAAERSPSPRPTPSETDDRHAL